MKFLIEYFVKRSFATNLIMFGIIISAVAIWGYIGKEERPEFSLNWVRVTVPYPGASAEEVEQFVLKPI